MDLRTSVNTFLEANVLKCNRTNLHPVKKYSCMYTPLSMLMKVTYTISCIVSRRMNIAMRMNATKTKDKNETFANFAISL